MGNLGLLVMCAALSSAAVPLHAKAEPVRPVGSEGQKDQTIAVELKPLLAAAPEPVRAGPAPEALMLQPQRRTQPASSSSWLWVGALGVVVAVGTAIMLGTLIGSRNTFEVSAPTTTRQTPPGAVIQLLRAP